MGDGKMTSALLASTGAALGDQAFASFRLSYSSLRYFISSPSPSAAADVSKLTLKKRKKKKKNLLEVVQFSPTGASVITWLKPIGLGFPTESPRSICTRVQSTERLGALLITMFEGMYAATRSRVRGG